MSPTRRELIRATRTRIVGAASRLTRERGPHGFSMDVLAKEAGVARATVYEHFRSKRALLDELTRSTARRVVLERTRPLSSEPLLALRDILHDVCRHWSEHDETMRELHTLHALTGGPGEQTTGDGIDDKLLRELVEELASAGNLRAHWSVDEAVDALAALTSYPVYERLRRAPRTPDEVEAVLAKLAVAVVTPQGAAASG